MLKLFKSPPKAPDRNSVLKTLSQVIDPETARDIVSLGLVSSVQITPDGHVIVVLEVPPEKGRVLEPLRQEAECQIAKLAGVQKATVILTAEKTQATPLSHTPDPHGMEKNPKLVLPIRTIIAVASGKGGVGKSTVAANLAFSLAQNSPYKVGLLDADIYGPSQPKMMGLEGYKPEFTAEKQIIPAHVQVGTYGLKIMSIGFMVDQSSALIWRGPMVQSALYQLFRDVQWGTSEDPLDILIVDMPPGTGDAQLTLAQKIPVSGAVIVSTPQDIALMDARKGIEMFRKTNIPVLGLIENMSTHICTQCGHEEHIFGHGGARLEAETLGIPFLGEIPLSRTVRENSDTGKPQGLPPDIIARLLTALENHTKPEKNLFERGISD